MRVIAGRYHLLVPLGSGGAGTVWRARDELLHREVAVKEVRLPQDGDRQRALVDTLREARAAASLSHPSIITVHDVLDEAGQPWIIMDLLAGRSLGDLVKERGPMPLGQVATVGLRMLDALEAAHRRGMLHRDVKPGNVMLTDDGEAILTDFGIAAHLGDAPGPAAAAAAAHFGSVAGSPGYIAPELLRGEHAGPPSDLWSLAATLYTAVEGRPPFERGTAMAVVAAVLTMPTPPPVNAGPLAGLLLAMLDKNPAARPHPQAVRAALEGFAVPLPTRAGRLAPATVPMRARRRRLPMVLLSLGAAAALATGAVLLSGDPAKTTTPVPPPSTPPPSTPPPSTAPPSTPASQAPPTQPAGGDGRFARPPKACSLLTDAQAQDLLPGSRAKQQGVYDESACSWAVGVVGLLENTSITLEVRHEDTTAAARTVFARLARKARSEITATQRSRVWAPRRLTAGDQAFLQDRWQTLFGATSTSTAWIRVSNVIVTAKVTHPKDQRKTPQLHQIALDTARAVADTLQKAP